MWTRSPARRWPTYVAVIVLLLSACSVWIGRVHLASMPLDRDEGEYAYTGQLLLQGVPPYEQAFTAKLPGTSAAYASLMALFGQTDTGIRYGFLLINAVVAGFVLLLCRGLLDPLSGLFAAACYLVLSFAREVQGMSANAEHFVLLFAVPGLWLATRYLELGKLWELALSGFFLGTGVLMKQHGIAFVIAGGVAVLAHELGPRPVRWSTVLKRGGLFGAAVLTPLLLTLGALAATGVFENFRFWILDYAPTYGSHHTWAHAWSLLRAVSARIFLGAPALWVLSGVGLVAAVFIREVRRRRWFAVPFLGMSVLAVCPGLVFRAHYFVLMLPVASVLFGIAVGAFVRRFREGPVATAVVLGIAASSLAITVDQQGSLWYVTDPEAVSRELFVQNPFAESLVFADYIRDHSEPGATVAVVGSEPQIPFYARRRSATAYIYMYPLMEDQPYAADMQRAAIREIEIAEPQYAVYVVNQMSWLINRKSSTWIVDWFNRYRIAHYRVVGVAVSQVERDSGKFLAPRYYWGEDAERIAARVLSLQKEAFQRTVPPGIVLFERRP